MALGAVFVVGMHRSGTSLSAGLMKRAGLAAMSGREMTPGPSNPHGNGEMVSLTAVNESLLADLGGAWATPPAFDPPLPFDQLTQSVREQARSRLWEVEPPASWHWKDPRLCLTLPFWLQQLRPATVPAVVFVHRHPVEVAASLNKRDRLALPRGLALWESYTRHALRAMEGLAVMAFAYDEALDQPVAIVERTRQWLGQLGIDLADPSPTEAVESWADTSVRHHQAEVAPAVELSGEQRALFDALTDLPAFSERFTPPELPPATPWAQALQASNRRLLQAKRELARRDEQRLRARLGRWRRQASDLLPGRR
jgi:hypothetical protein